MYKNLKEIINIIKYAAGDDEEEAPPLPVTTPPATTPAPAKSDAVPVESFPVATNPVTKKTAPSQPISSTIKKMQSSLQKFYNTVLEIKKSSPEFNDYLTERHVSTNAGKEYTENKAKVKEEQKGPTNLHIRDITLESVFRIGNMRSEATPDGNWGFRTNNALHNTYGFAYALYKLYKSLGIPAPIDFSESDLTDFHSNLIDQSEVSKTPFSEKVKKAEVLNKLVIKLIEFYKQFANSVMNNPNFSDYIKGEKPLFKITKDPNSLKDLTKEDKQRADNLTIGPCSLTNKNGTRVSGPVIPVSYLENKTVLSNFATSFLGYTEAEVAGNDNIIKNIFNEILAHVNAVLNYKAKRNPQTPSK